MMQPVINRLKDFKIASCFQKLWTYMSIFFFIKEWFVVIQKWRGSRIYGQGGRYCKKDTSLGKKLKFIVPLWWWNATFCFFSIPIPNCLFDWIWWSNECSMTPGCSTSCKHGTTWHNRRLGESDTNNYSNGLKPCLSWEIYQSADLVLLFPVI